MKKWSLISVALVLACSSIAQAGFTDVFSPPGSEAYITDILDNVYGGTFDNPHNQTATIYTNGSVTATRLQDSGGNSPLNLVTGNSTEDIDNIWIDGIANITAEAKFAGYSQMFGYSMEGSSAINWLFNVTGNEFGVSGSGAMDFEVGTTWQWVRGGQGGEWYSDPGSNDDGLDHMITYQITGLSDSSTTTTWLLFWEDLRGPYSCWGSDRDFNDLVVEIRGSVGPAPGPGPVIPAPSAVFLGGIGVVLVGWLRRRRTL